MLRTVFGLIRKYNIEKIYIDGANPSFIRSLKIQLDEDPDYEKAISRLKSEGWDWENSSWMQVVPVNFHTRHKEMLAHSKLLLERGHVAINPKFDKLMVALSPITLMKRKKNPLLVLMFLRLLMLLRLTKIQN